MPNEHKFYVGKREQAQSQEQCEIYSNYPNMKQ